MLQQPRFDLTEFDAEPADLHLKIIAPQKLDVPVGQVPPKVARLVQTVARYERARDEPLRRQLSPVQISPRDTRAANMDLPRNTTRNRLAMSVQEINPCVRYRTPNRHRTHLFEVIYP